MSTFCLAHKRLRCPACSVAVGIPTDAWGSTAAPLPGRLPLGRGNQAQVADTVRKVTGKALEVAAFNSYAG